MVEDIEWVTISVIGQSFLLHQIRKMIGVVISITRDHQTNDVITALFNERKASEIQLAPGEGLMLRQASTFNWLFTNL